LRHLIAYFFILVFSLQLLPIKEIGEILFKGQITEEEVHGQHAEDNTKLKKQHEPNPFLASSNNTGRITYLSQMIRTVIHSAETLPPHFVPEIITPPPNINSFA
jgi:hypothetical protein